MSRPVDWTPLAGGDPVPGDPWEVASAARHYRDVAQAILDAADKLTRLASHEDGQVSHAVDSLRKDCHDVASDIRRAHERYAGVAQALSAYAPALEDAQRRSLSALRSAQEAEAAARSAQRRQDEATDDTERSAADRDAVCAQEQLDTARGTLQGAVQDRDDAANRAISAIKDVQDSGDLNDGWWDNWGHKVVSVIQQVASGVATVCGLLALAVGWIPVVGQAAAAVLGTIALIGTVVSLACNIALASTDYGGWSEVVLDAVSLATFGVGRVLGYTAKGASRAFQGLSRMRAGSLAARGGGASTMRGLLGGQALASDTRGVARGMFRSGLRAQKFGARNIVRSLRGVPAEFRDGVSTLRGASAADWRTGVRAGARQLRQGTWGERAKLLYGETDLVEHDEFVRHLSRTLLRDEQLVKATRSYQGRALTMLGVETYDHGKDIDDGRKLAVSGVEHAVSGVEHAVSAVSHAMKAGS